MSSQKKSKKNMTVERRVQKRRIVVNIHQPMRKNPMLSRNIPLVPPPRAETMLKPPGVRIMAKEIQKPP